MAIFRMVSSPAWCPAHLELLVLRLELVVLVTVTVGELVHLDLVSLDLVQNLGEQSYTEFSFSLVRFNGTVNTIGSFW